MGSDEKIVQNGRKINELGMMENGKQNGHALMNRKDADTDMVEEEDTQSDDIYLEERINVPEPDGTWFSWRKLWLFTGPGWLSKNTIYASHTK